MTKLIDGPFIAPQSGAAKNLVVFLHGYGSNGDDLISIGREWAPYLPDTAFVSPNAPEVCEIWAQGYQWFSIRAIDPDAFEREKQAEKAMPALNAFLDAQLENGGCRKAACWLSGFRRAP